MEDEEGEEDDDEDKDEDDDDEVDVDEDGALFFCGDMKSTGLGGVSVSPLSMRVLAWETDELIWELSSKCSMSCCVSPNSTLSLLCVPVTSSK
jgi:hypothetical protein